MSECTCGSNWTDEYCGRHGRFDPSLRRVHELEAKIMKAPDRHHMELSASLERKDREISRLEQELLTQAERVSKLEAALKQSNAVLLEEKADDSALELENARLRKYLRYISLLAEAEDIVCFVGLAEEALQTARQVQQDDRRSLTRGPAPDVSGEERLAYTQEVRVQPPSSAISQSQTDYARGFADGHKCCAKQIEKLEQELAETARPDPQVAWNEKCYETGYQAGLEATAKDSSVIDKKQTEPVIHREQAQQDCGCRIANGGNAALTCPHGNKIGGAQSVRERKP